MASNRTELVPAPAFDPALRRRAWLITVLIVGFMVLNFADKAVLGLSAHAIMTELGISNSTYGAISSSFYLLFSASGLIVGFASTRISSRVLLCAMTALWAVAQLPVLLLAAVPTLIANRVLLGAAEGPAASMSMHALYKWFPPERRGLPSALQISGAALGTLISAPLLTGVIAAFGWRAAFAVLAVISAAWSIVWWKVGSDGPYADTGAPAGSAPSGDRTPYRRLLLNGTVLGSIASAFGAHWALTVSNAWLPVYLTGQLGMTPATTATTISLIAGVSLVLLLTVSPLVSALTARGFSSRWSTGAPQGVAVIIAGAAMLAFPFVEATGPRLVLIAVAFGCHAVALPLHYMTTAEVVPARRRGAVFGIVAATGTLPGLVAPLLSGQLIDAAATDRAGYATAFALSAVIMLVCGAFAVATIRPERDARRLSTRN
ncbi:MFS transporter [Saccharopolyspora sp. MS10]|uniref:MFS transporter n=1 Tax=Saccharopolyspora sp. MS10 TaxID=3385973 RepID=UPI0039A008FC